MFKHFTAYTPQWPQGNKEMTWKVVNAKLQNVEYIQGCWNEYILSPGESHVLKGYYFAGAHKDVGYSLLNEHLEGEKNRRLPFQVNSVTGMLNIVYLVKVSICFE